MAGIFASFGGTGFAACDRMESKLAHGRGLPLAEARGAGTHPSPVVCRTGNFLGLVDYAPIPLAAGVSEAHIAAQPISRGRRSLLCLVPPAPRIPARGRSMSTGGSISVLIHASALAVLLAAAPHWRSAPSLVATAAPISNRQPVELPRMIFLQVAGPGGGGGGGGNRQPKPPSRAEAIGSDRLTIPIARRVVATPRPTDATPSVQRLVLDAKPLASGTRFLIGTPDAPSSLPFSQGPGSGGGVGEGTGTGIGAGTGPGVGTGTGGGFGGGAYRVGDGVTPPVPLKEVKPRYNAEALRLRIEGSVTLEAIVGRDGIPVALRVTRSLDRGLDEEALAAAREWRFAPGRIAGTPVDVIVTILMEFRIR
jgi:TonB family protein